MITPIQKLIPSGTKRRPGFKLLGVKFIVCHDTGNPNSTAMQNVNYYIKSANEMEASAHTFVDDKEIIECIPLDEKAYHVRRKQITLDNEIYGGDAIDYALGIELCYFPNDVERTKTAYKNYVAYIADLCRKYSLQASQHLVGHYKLDPARRTDPLNAFKYIGKSWEQFVKDVADYFHPNNVCIAEKEKISEMQKTIDLLISYVKKLMGMV